MLKKTITFQDLDGNDVTEDFYFSLNKAEIAEMELSHPGGLGAYLNEIVETNDGAAIISTFKMILEKAVGRRSEDGRRLIKNQDVVNDFMQSDAYSVLFMELVTDGEAAAKFVEAIVPQDMKDILSSEKPLVDIPLPDKAEETKDDRPAWIRDDREPTKEEMASMSKDELLEAFRRRNMSE